MIFGKLEIFVICKVSLVSFPLLQNYEMPGKYFPNSSEKKQGDYNKCFQGKNFSDISYNYMLL